MDKFSPFYLISILHLYTMRLIQPVTSNHPSYSSKPGVWGSNVKACVFEGHLMADRDWYGYLANITIPSSGRLQFEFYFPTSKCCPFILFYTDDQLALLKPRMSCWQKEGILKEENDQILRLTPRFIHSGCHITYPNGVSTHACKGGRSVIVEGKPVTWYIAASNCAPVHGFDLRYRLEMIGHVDECPHVYKQSHDVMQPNRDVMQQNHDVINDAVDYNDVNTKHVHPSDLGELKAVSSEEESMAKAGGETGNICILRGNLNTTDNWYGFLVNMSLNAGGGFYFRFTFPYAMQPLSVVLYKEEDLYRFTPDKNCDQRDGVIKLEQVREQVVKLNSQATYNGCYPKNHSHGRNLTCKSSKRFPEATRKFHMAVLNCRSTTGIQLHYQIEIFNYSSNPCRAAGGLRASMGWVALGLIYLWLRGRGSDRRAW